MYVYRVAEEERDEFKKSYYLSERIYETMNCEENKSRQRKKYSRNLLGETMFDQMYKENINFYGYVPNGNEYAVRENVKLKKRFIMGFYHNMICLEINLQIKAEFRGKY